MKIERAFQMSPSKMDKAQQLVRRLDPWASMQTGSSSVPHLEQPNFLLPEPVAYQENPGEPPPQTAQGPKRPVNNTIVSHI